VALLGPAVLEAQRQQLQARVRAGTGGGLQTTTPAAGVLPAVERVLAVVAADGRRVTEEIGQCCSERRLA
jgi:hypothetical protein